MAKEQAFVHLAQGDLFTRDDDGYDLWAGIYLAACEAEVEERICREQCNA
ncbi:hypothetical protein GCM10025793_19450 [Lysobacter lycopersici]